MLLSPLFYWRWFLKLQDRLASRLARVAEGLSIARPPTTELMTPTAHTVRFEKFSLWLRVSATVSAAVLLLLLRPPNLVFMYIVVAIFAVYTFCIARVFISHKPQWLAGGYLLFTIDSILLGVAVALTGGMSSVFAVCYIATMVLHSLRYGVMHLLFAPILSMATLAGGVIAAGAGPADLARMAFWDFWIALTALVSGLLVERGRRAEGNLATELRRTQALLEAAHAPAASLTVEGVLQATLTQARRLTRSDLGAVQLFGRRRQPAAYLEELDDEPGAAAFRHLVRGDFRARQALLSAARPLTPADLAEVRTNGKDLDQLSSLCAAPIPSQRGSPQGFVALARRSVPPLGQVEFEALSALLERAALAVQNARLYEQVQSQLQELRALHSSLIRADRLAAIGELAAKVAHELNNPLTSIMLYNSLLVEERASPAEQQRVSQRIVEEVDRARRVIRNVLDYSRATAPAVEKVRIQPLLRRAIQLVEHGAKVAGVEVVSRVPDHVAQITADPPQLTQVFINLMLNAIHAMPQGGQLTVEAGMDGDEVFVAIDDTGVGIDPEYIDRIFEPFFTTRRGEEGTGLGLAVSRTLVAQHGGRITVASQPGQGSQFTVWLPVAESPEVALVH